MLWSKAFPWEVWHSTNYKSLLTHVYTDMVVSIVPFTVSVLLQHNTFPIVYALATTQYTGTYVLLRVRQSIGKYSKQLANF